MCYYYIFKLRYVKGKSHIIKYYLVAFNEIKDFINYLEKKHKNNYTIENIFNYHLFKNNFIIDKFWKEGKDNYEL